MSHEQGASEQHQKDHWTSFNPHDIGIKMLKDRRDKITNGGKYSDRYRDTFSHEVKDEKYPLSVKCRETLDQHRNVPKSGEKSDSSRQSPNFTTEMMGTPKAMPSNATNDLNKQENALIGYKAMPDRGAKFPILTHHNTSPSSGHRQLKWPSRRNKDVNIYSITPASDSSTPYGHQPHRVALNLILNDPVASDNTMSHLDNVETIISKLNEKEKQEDNLRKFDELVKKVIKQPAPAPPLRKAPPRKAAPQVDQSQDILRPPKSLLNPMKPSKEVEDLQARGFSDAETDDNDEAHFKRHVTERKSMDHQGGAKERSAEVRKNTSLNRTASDVQDKNVVTLKRKPRLSRDRNKVMTAIWHFKKASQRNVQEFLYAVFQICRFKISDIDRLCHAL